MENQDTIYLLKECDAGSKMAVSSIVDVINQVNDNNLKKLPFTFRQLFSVSSFYR